jgi:hypothetical protein
MLHLSPTPDPASNWGVPVISHATSQGVYGVMFGWVVDITNPSLVPFDDWLTPATIWKLFSYWWWIPIEKLVDPVPVVKVDITISIREAMKIQILRNMCEKLEHLNAISLSDREEVIARSMTDLQWLLPAQIYTEMKNRVNQVTMIALKSAIILTTLNAFLALEKR